MRELEQYIGELYSQGKENPITFCIYPGRDNKYTLYLDDDGKTRNAETKQIYRVTEISHEGIENGQRVRVKRSHDKFKPPETFYYVALLGTTAPKSVNVAGIALSRKTGDSDDAAAKALAGSKTDAFYHNGFLKTTYIKVFDQKADVTIEATF
jgi:alpha-glucosidase